MEIKEEKLRNAVNVFTNYMKSRLAEKEAAGYVGWDGEYPRKKLMKEIRRDFKIIESGFATTKHAVDICNRLFMIDFNSMLADVKARRVTKTNSRSTKKRPVLKIVDYTM
jgi:hypothetical protein